MLKSRGQKMTEKWGSIIGDDLFLWSLHETKNNYLLFILVKLEYFQERAKLKFRFFTPDGKIQDKND